MNRQKHIRVPALQLVPNFQQPPAMMSGYRCVVACVVSVGEGNSKTIDGEYVPTTCVCCLPSIQSQVFWFALFALVGGVRSSRKKPSELSSGISSSELNVKVWAPTANSGIQLCVSWERWTSERARKRGARGRGVEDAIKERGGADGAPEVGLERPQRNIRASVEEGAEAGMGMRRRRRRRKEEGVFFARVGALYTFPAADKTVHPNEPRKIGVLPTTMLDLRSRTRRLTEVLATRWRGEEVRKGAPAGFERVEFAGGRGPEPEFVASFRQSAENTEPLQGSVWRSRWEPEIGIFGVSCGPIDAQTALKANRVVEEGRRTRLEEGAMGVWKQNGTDEVVLSAPGSRSVTAWLEVSRIQASKLPQSLRCGESCGLSQSRLGLKHGTGGLASNSIVQALVNL
ncbi:hypothetical protein C8R46DRAFT_1193028 [Mycena filopes]|nr:hypothetical protein C8R46DRAFT_1193028 [Mycena filopes]